MLKHSKYSIRLHWVTMLCFLLPFFYTGCDISREEKEAEEMALADSTKTIVKVEEINSDSTSVHADSLLATRMSELTDTSNSKKDSKEKTISGKIVEKYSILQPILVPKEGVYSGIAVVIDTFSYLAYCTIFICFLLLIISLITKYMEPKAKKIIALLNLLAFISLLFSHPYSWDSVKLWGYWTTLAILFILTLYDLYIIKLSKNETQSS
jgi:hypothetical protein